MLTGCKVGSQLFTAAGPAAVEMARKRGGRVFLDLKFHDIPNTVAAAVREATRLGVFMLNVHASGGLAMARAGAEAAATAAGESACRADLLAVTVLTSLDRARSSARSACRRASRPTCCTWPASPATRASTAVSPRRRRSAPLRLAMGPRVDHRDARASARASGRDDQAGSRRRGVASGRRRLPRGRAARSPAAPDPAAAAAAILAELGAP